jgi:pimeloyl-ACP methyl ester carboxylesterase
MKKPAPSRVVVNLRRAYFESRYGQLHARTAFPSTGGFDEHPALVLLHDCPQSSRSFLEFLPVIGTDRSVYALDTPGFGESDGPAEPPAVADYALAVGDFLDNLRLRQFDLVGHGVGAAIAAEIAIARPAAVRRVVFVGLPVYTTGERQAFEANPVPVSTAADGRHALLEWQRQQALPAPRRTLAELAASVADALASGPGACWGSAAAHTWPARERLVLVATPALVLRPKDALWEATRRADGLLPQARWKDLPEHGTGLFSVAPGDVAAELREFLDA